MNSYPTKVLIGQENSSLSDAFKSLFSENGLDVQLTTNGNQVLDIIRSENPPDLLLVDYSLRNPTALEICRMVKSDPELGYLPVILILPPEMRSDEVLAVEAGFDDILIHPVSPHALLARVQSLLRIKILMDGMDDAESVLYALTRTMEAKDQFTMGHADRVAHYAVDLGKSMGLSEEDLAILRQGGMLHDIGKIAIPDVILSKPGVYTPDEFNVMKQHPVFGCQICQKLKSVRGAIPLIRNHHEKLDGTGYPDGLKAVSIPLLVRIINVTDIYDALRSRRSYKEPFSMEKSLEILWSEVEKGWWDGHVLKEWEKLVISFKVAG